MPLILSSLERALLFPWHGLVDNWLIHFLPLNYRKVDFLLEEKCFSLLGMEEKCLLCHWNSLYYLCLDLKNLLKKYIMNAKLKPEWLFWDVTQKYLHIFHLIYVNLCYLCDLVMFNLLTLPCNFKCLLRS